MAKGNAQKGAPKQGAKKAQQQKGEKPAAAPKQGAKKVQQQQQVAKERAQQGAKKAQQDAGEEGRAQQGAKRAPSTDRYMCKTWFMKDRPSWPGWRLVRLELDLENSAVHETWARDEV